MITQTPNIQVLVVYSIVDYDLLIMAFNSSVYAKYIGNVLVFYLFFRQHTHAVCQFVLIDTVLCDTEQNKLKYYCCTSNPQKSARKIYKCVRVSNSYTQISYLVLYGVCMVVEVIVCCQL